VPFSNVGSQYPKFDCFSRAFQVTTTRHGYEARAYRFFEAYYCYGERKLYARNKVGGDVWWLLFQHIHILRETPYPYKFYEWVAAENKLVRATVVATIFFCL